MKGLIFGGIDSPVESHGSDPAILKGEIDHIPGMAGVAPMVKDDLE